MRGDKQQTDSRPDQIPHLSNNGKRDARDGLHRDHLRQAA
jgi:hypothetical protein